MQCFYYYYYFLKFSICHIKHFISLNSLNNKVVDIFLGSSAPPNTKLRPRGGEHLWRIPELHRETTPCGVSANPEFGTD